MHLWGVTGGADVFSLIRKKWEQRDEENKKNLEKKNQQSAADLNLRTADKAASRADPACRDNSAALSVPIWILRCYRLFIFIALFIFHCELKVNLRGFTWRLVCVYWGCVCLRGEIKSPVVVTNLSRWRVFSACEQLQPINLWCPSRIRVSILVDMWKYRSLVPVLMTSFMDWM